MSDNAAAAPSITDMPPAPGPGGSSAAAFMPEAAVAADMVPMAGAFDTEAPAPAGPGTEPGGDPAPAATLVDVPAQQRPPPRRAPAILAGGLAIATLAVGAVAWQRVSTPAADAAATAALIEAQAFRLAEQAAQIEALSRAVRAHAEPAPAAPAVRLAEASDPAAVAGTTARASSIAGSATCDIPASAEGYTAIRKCIEWFNRAQAIEPVQ
jgi:hypothetical protein